MNAPALMRCGLTCDYTSECLGFLRTNFDIEDPDVACLPGVLAEFAKRQRLLFVDGYILCDGSQVPRLPGSLNSTQRSATQLVYEEIQTPEPRLVCTYPCSASCKWHVHGLALALAVLLRQPRIFYGKRVHYLCTKAGVQEIRAIMGTMSHVVEATLERLQVDLTSDEIAVALEVFNIPLWQDLARREALLASARKLCAMLKLPPRTGDAIGQFARALEPHLQAAKAERPEFGNKHAWSWLLRPTWRARHAGKILWTEACGTLVAFYLSLKINTTTLERDLGHLLTQLEAHSGPLSPNGSTVASIMEVAIDGPQREEDSFLKPQCEGGLLTPTDFGVLCGELWIRHFGRRFRCTYNKEPNQGGPESRASSVLELWPRLSEGVPQPALRQHGARRQQPRRAGCGSLRVSWKASACPCGQRQLVPTALLPAHVGLLPGPPQMRRSAWTSSAHAPGRKLMETWLVQAP